MPVNLTWKPSIKQPTASKLSFKPQALYILIVGHSANLTASIRSLPGYEPALLRVLGGLDNLSLTVLETADSQVFECLLWNDTSYLEDNIHKKDWANRTDPKI